MNELVFWSLLLVGGIWASWLAWALQTWRLHFSRRPSRSNPSSPSNGGPPTVRPRAMQSSAGCPVLLGQGTLGSKGSCPVRGTQTCNFMMDMNHVPLTLWQYLWAAHCIALPAFALVVLGSNSKPLSDLWFDFPFLSVVWLLALAGRSRTARHSVSFFNMQSSGHELAPFLSR